MSSVVVEGSRRFLVRDCEYSSSACESSDLDIDASMSKQLTSPSLSSSSSSSSTTRPYSIHHLRASLSNIRKQQQSAYDSSPSSISTDEEINSLFRLSEDEGEGDERRGEKRKRASLDDKQGSSKKTTTTLRSFLADIAAQPSSSTSSSRRTNQVIISDDMRWNSEKCEEEDAKEHLHKMQPIMSPLQKRLEQLRIPGECSDWDPERPDCWGCNFSETKGEEMFATHFNSLCDMFTTKKTNTELNVLAKQMFTYFSKHVIVVEEGKDKTGRRNIQVVPDKVVWTAYSMIYHFLVHDKSPEAKNFWQHINLDSINNVILRNEIFVKHQFSERVCTDMNAIKKLKIIDDLNQRTMNARTKKQNWFNRDMHVDIEIGRPAINLSGKQLISDVPFQQTDLWMNIRN